jgi:putative transposase
MITGIKFHSNPIPKMRLTMAQWMGCQRSIYNAKVAENNYFRTFRNKSLTFTGFYIPRDQTYSQFKNKELTPWMYKVPSQILRNGAVRYEKGMAQYFAGISGLPTFKKSNGRQSVWITSELFRFVDKNNPYLFNRKFYQ